MRERAAYTWAGTPGVLTMDLETRKITPVAVPWEGVMGPRRLETRVSYQHEWR